MKHTTLPCHDAVKANILFRKTHFLLTKSQGTTDLGTVLDDEEFLGRRTSTASALRLGGQVCRTLGGAGLSAKNTVSVLDHTFLSLTDITTLQSVSTSICFDGM